MRRLSAIHQPFGVVLVAMLLAACVSTPAQPLPAPTYGAATRPIALTDAPAIADAQAPQLLAWGLHARMIGDYDAAAHDFHALINTYPQAAETRAGRYYLAESFALRGRWASAADALQAFLASGTPDDFAARAMFWLARSHEEAGNAAAAVQAYAQYRALHTPLEAYAQLRQAAQQQANGQLAEAAASYAALAQSDLARGERAGAHEVAIALYRQLGRNDKALELYQQLLRFAEQPSYRTRILDEAAALARVQGDSAQAQTWERELIIQFPTSAEALAAAARVATDQPALPAAAVANVYEAHEQFAAALPLLDAAIAAGGSADTRDLRRRRALAVRASGDFDTAMAELAALTAANPHDEISRQAQLDWAQTRGQHGELPAAIAAYQSFAQTYPDDTGAPTALERAATLLERQGDSEGAIAQWLALGTRYPANEDAQRALDHVAWQFLRTNRPAAAQSAWTLLANNTAGPIAARAAFWAARAAHAAGADAAVGPLTARVLQQAPDSYYGLRVAELQHPMAAPSAALTTTTTLAQWQAAEDWLVSWAKPTVPPQRYPATIRDDPNVIRALALADVGLFDQAINEWDVARIKGQNDPFKLYAIARLASEHGMPAISLFAADDLVALVPTNAPPVPDAIQRLRYPTPYADVVMAQAQAFGIDPRLLYALLRQESHFNPRAASGAGARGLAQVMPETAQGIATELKTAAFSSSDLDRPLISVQFGAFYLSRQLEYMHGSIVGALAAYNSGYGNARRWADGSSVVDQDLFVETIDFPETTSYVKLVSSYYGAYRRLYADAKP